MSSNETAGRVMLAGFSPEEDLLIVSMGWDDMRSFRDRLPEFGERAVFVTADIQIPGMRGIASLCFVGEEHPSPPTARVEADHAVFSGDFIALYQFVARLLESCDQADVEHPGWHVHYDEFSQPDLEAVRPAGRVVEFMLAGPTRDE